MLFRSMILSKYISKPNNVLRVTFCGGKRYMAISDTESSTKIATKPHEKKPPVELDPKKLPAKTKKRKYDIKQVLDNFSALGTDPLEVKEIPRIDNAASPIKIRRNEVNIEMLPPSLYAKIFGNDQGAQINPQKLELARKHLQQNGLLDKIEPPLPEIDFPLPPLQVYFLIFLIT